MRTALYHRVSTTDQDPTLASAELLQAARRYGAEIVMHIEEVGSGAKNDRPGLQAVLAAAQAGQIDCVMVWKLDRWGRSSLDLLSNIDALQAHGVRFIAITQGLDIKPGGDPVGRLLLTMLAAVGEFERSLIRERVTLGLRRAKERGTRSGRPIGRAHSTTPAQRAAVRALRSCGKTWREITEQMGVSREVARRAVRERPK
jgi:putative DNA-invertase from lambdoid prophage Rac